jgi:hypothetical protein
MVNYFVVDADFDGGGVGVGAAADVRAALPALVSY